MTSVSVILNGYRRPDYLKYQVEAVQNQSIKTEILYWHNYEKPVQYDKSVVNQLMHAISNRNWGVWARFAYALNARSDYICILDDDTIPGKDWLKNCVETYDKYPGLLGTIGLWFEPDYITFRRVGWDKRYINTNDTQQVDIVGHAWFFARDLLSVFWRELPPLHWNLRIGEDIHFSYMLQKYTKYKTWVPPHPDDNKDLWGSLKAAEYGGDYRATYKEESHNIVAALEYYKEKGFRTMYADQNSIF